MLVDIVLGLLLGTLLLFSGSAYKSKLKRLKTETNKSNDKRKLLILQYAKKIADQGIDRKKIRRYSELHNEFYELEDYLEKKQMEV